MQRLLRFLLIASSLPFARPDCSVNIEAGLGRNHLDSSLYKEHSISCSNSTSADIKRAFSGKKAKCPNLKSITVEDSETEEIDADTFGVAGQLDCLTKVYFESCHVQSVALDTFSKFPNIADVSFRNNNIRNVEFVRRLHNVVSLDLSFNGIKDLQDDDFKVLLKLRYLDLSNNLLKKVPMGLESLDSLFLIENSIEVLENHTLSSLSNLQTLSLDDNKISNIEAEAFAGLVWLTTLNLSNNTISNLQESRFKDLKSLRQLDLSHNHIAELDSKTFLGLGSIRKLLISYNSIKTISWGTFNKLVNLEVLALEHNNLKSILTGTFSYLHKLIGLNLSYNSILRLNDQTLFPLRDLEYLILNNNKLSYLGSRFGKAVYKNLRRVEIGVNDWVCEELFNLLFTLRDNDIDYLPQTPKFTQRNIDGIGCR